MVNDQRQNCDVVVVGGGIVGLSSAWHLLRAQLGRKVVVLEKERDIALHQSGRNSGVVHAGVYYAPGSLKAQYCHRGREAVQAFCQERGLAYQRCGKLIVATTELERRRLEQLSERASLNGLDLAWLDSEALAEQEPRIRGVAACRVRESAIVDYRQLAVALRDELMAAGADIVTGVEVVHMHEQRDAVLVDTSHGRYRASGVVNCGGLMADRLVRMMGLPCDFRIVPFRGEFFRLAERCRGWIQAMIYPVPNPDLPFLGVHLTPTIGGEVTAGPNAVLAFKREGYSWRDISLADIWDMAAYPGFWKMLGANAGAGVKEMLDSLLKERYLRELQRYCPSLVTDDLLPHPAGVRAQAVDNQGRLIHDFHFIHSARSLHVGNAPSPAATAALPIGEHVATRLIGQLWPDTL